MSNWKDKVESEKINLNIDKSNFIKQSYNVHVTKDHPHYPWLLEKRNWRVANDYPWKKSPLEKRKVQGIAFLGCSFTWGQGLYFYSNLDSLREPEYCRYDSLLVKPSHVKYAESVRFSRTVANHFNTFDMAVPSNGGTNQTIIRWFIDDVLNVPNSSNFGGTYAPCEFSDFSHIVFQMTEWSRKRFYITVDGTRYELLNNNHKHDTKISSIFDKFLLENGITIDEFEQFMVESNFQDVKDFLQFVEQNGVKTYVMTWPDAYVSLIKNDEFMNERFIQFSYKDTHFDSITELMNQHKEMVIMYDYEEFVDTPKDMHPSLKCHQVIANSIIKKMEKV